MEPFDNPLQSDETPGPPTYENRASDQDFWQNVGFPETSPQAAWQRGLGLPATGRNLFQEWQAGQAKPAFAGWGARAAALPLGITPIPGQAGQVPGPNFSDYIGAGGAQKGYSSALGTLNQMRGQGGESQQNWMDTLAAQGGPGLQNVLEAAMRGKGYAGFVARNMAGRTPGLETGWEAQTMGGAQPDDTLLNYLIKHMGL